MRKTSIAFCAGLFVAFAGAHTAHAQGTAVWGGTAPRNTTPTAVAPTQPQAQGPAVWGGTAPRGTTPTEVVATPPQEQGPAVWGGTAPRGTTSSGETNGTTASTSAAVPKPAAKNQPSLSKPNACNTYGDKFTGCKRYN